MKVYKALTDVFIDNTHICICKTGEEIYESSCVYKPNGGGYVLTKRQVEEDEHFLFVREDCHDADYYMKRIYTQAEVDKLLAKNENNY